MTIRKGQEWGSLTVAAAAMATVSSNAELRAMVEAARKNGSDITTVGLLGGDLMRTLGGSAQVSRFTSGEQVPHLPIDLVHVVADGSREGWFAAHLVARHTWWRGQIVAAMNAQFINMWDVAPRCHPNDGLVDLVTANATMNLQQRWLARSRLRLGTHVPHPLITTRQLATASLDLPGKTPLWLDGQRWGSARHVQITVEPDAFVVVV